MIPKSGHRFSKNIMLIEAAADAPSRARNVGVARPGAFTLPISPVISMTSGALGEAGGPMKTNSVYRSIPLALAAVVGLLSADVAQQSPPAKQQNPPAKQAKPATKSETKSEAKSPPPKQGKQAAPSPAGTGGAQPTLLGQFGD